ncbi:hypothetical protein F5X98DRAFT_382154 [Xylaria grammica]|nr:hypothetical protein F5X98DRAFT_382154 [Xylaria grammica]
MNNALSSSTVSRTSDNSVVSRESDHCQSSNRFTDINTPLVQQKDMPTAALTARTTRSGLTMAWLPYTLRWPYFLAIVTFIGLLEIAVIVVHSISWRNSGLVEDDGSGILQIRAHPTCYHICLPFINSLRRC